MIDQDTNALSGLKVVDLTRQMAGPYASLVLGDFGADIVKIESKGEGDPIRGVGHHFIAGQSTLFYQLNRNKRSLCLDMRNPKGLAVVKRLIAQADVLMENYRPGVADEIGIGAEAMLELNPRLVYASTNAFGSKGPWKHLPGTDPIVQAMSGVMSVTGEPDGGPVLVGTPIADYISSMLTVQGILLGLAARDHTGRGQHVEVSMLASLLFGLTTRIGPYFLTGENPTRFGSAHSQVVPYQAFRSSDGWLVAGVWGRGWPDFCKALEVPELAEDERFLTNPQRVERRDELTAILDPEFLKHTTAYWKDSFERHHTLFSPVNTFSDVLEGEQAKANELVIEIDHPVAGPMRQVAAPVKLEDTPATVRFAPPVVGEHTGDVLSELGLTDGEIHELLDEGVVVQGSVEEAIGAEAVAETA
jgi:crotonobetainyl-CoA:carnitine CoA-transferase CaiB-like acyl-CoA transferase